MFLESIFCIYRSKNFHVLSHITTGSNSFVVTPGHSSSKTIFGSGKTVVHQELVKPPDLFLSPSMWTRLSCGETEGGQVRKACLLKITRKAASFASHGGACARARRHSFDFLWVYFSLFFISLVLCLDARQETCAVGYRYIKAIAIVLSCILGSVAVLIDMIEKSDIVLLNLQVVPKKL